MTARWAKHLDTAATFDLERTLIEFQALSESQIKNIGFHLKKLT